MFDDLVRQIPRKKEHFVGHLLEEALGSDYGYADSGHVAALFVDVAVGHKRHSVAADATGVQQHRTLCCCTVGGDVMSIGQQRVEQRRQPPPELVDLLREPLEVGEPGDADLLLLGEECSDVSRDRDGTSTRAAKTRSEPP